MPRPIYLACDMAVLEPAADLDLAPVDDLLLFALALSLWMMVVSAIALAYDLDFGYEERLRGKN